MFLLITLLSLSMVTCATADTWAHEASGITLVLPDGMTGEDTSTEGSISLYVENAAEDAPVYYIFIEYDEEYAGIWMEDLDEQGVQSVAEYYTPEGMSGAYTMLPTGNTTLLVLAGEGNTEAVVVALLNGWFISVEATATEGNQLAEGAYADVESLVAAIQLPAAQ